MSKKITVLGATGNVGTALVRLLLDQGHHVTAVARSSARLDALAQAGATPRAGNAHDAAFLTEALRGADAAFLLIPPDLAAPDGLAHMQQVGEAIAQAVRATGLPQAVNLSGIWADETDAPGPVAGLHQQEIRLNAVAGLAVAHLRPTYFLENLLANIGLIQHLGITGSATRPDLALPMVASRDIAAKAAELLNAVTLLPQSVHYLLGARNYTMPEATAAIGQALGRPELTYVHFSPADAHQGMLSAGLSESMADLYGAMNHQMNAGKPMQNGPRDAANTTPTTLEAFVQTVFVPAFQAATA